MIALADTSALYALLDEDDDVHAAAVDRFARHLAVGSLTTHSYVLVETCALLQHRLGLAAVRQFDEAIRPVLHVIWVDADLHDAAMAAVLSSRSRAVSLVDRTSFEVMRRHGIDVAFAFDDHFRAAGFRLL